MTTTVKLHCPCGVVQVTVPVMKGAEGRLQSDSERSVCFINVDSYATGIDIEVSLPETHIWPEMGDRTRLTAGFCYSGAFYCIVDAEELGFHGLKSADLGALIHRRASSRACSTASQGIEGSFIARIKVNCGLFTVLLYEAATKDSSPRESTVPNLGCASLAPGNRWIDHRVG